MSFRICSIASGSKGNCAFVSSSACRLLVDVGITVKRVEQSLRALGVSATSIDGILVTHTHSDHIKGVASFASKYGVDVYCHDEVYDKMSKLLGLNAKLRLIPIFERDFFVKDITVSPFWVCHDVDCMGFAMYHRGAKISIATDLGHISASVMRKISGSDIALVEANHDEDKLRVNPEYPRYLKERILSARGHLSNESCGHAIVKLVASGVRQVILGHLSDSNNYPELALSTVQEILLDNGIDPSGVRITVATQDRMSSVYKIDTDVMREAASTMG